MTRLSLAEAEALIASRLGETLRAAHSRFVGALLERLAREVQADTDLWLVAGLVHDLDYFAVGGDWSRHGRLTAEWLAGRLPDEALEAIAAHDHRTGITSSTALADMLKLADALAVLDEAGGRKAMCEALRTDSLAQLAGDRPYLASTIESLARRQNLTPSLLAGLFDGLPLQA